MRVGVSEIVASTLGVALALIAAAPAAAEPGEALRMRSGSFELAGLDGPIAIGASDRPRAVVALERVPTARERLALREAGVEIGQYLGDGRFVARGRPADLRAFARRQDVRGAAWMRAEMKVDVELRARQFQTPERRAELDAGRATLRVFLHADTTDDEALAARQTIEGWAGTRVYPSRRVGGNPVFTIEAGLDDADRVAALEAVQFVEHAPEITYRNSTARGVVQSGVAGDVPLHDAGLTGDGQILHVTDSGLDTAHCAFSTVPGKLIAFNGAPLVTNHGTHVAGIAVGNPGNAGDLRGHAFDSQFVFTRTPAFTFTDLTSVYENASAQGARIHTNSWGDDSTKVYTGLCRAIDAYMHENEDELIVFAASNQADLRSPENAKSCVSVAASKDDPLIDDFCDGGVGLTLDNRLKPEIFAPGCNIRSALANSACNTVGQTGTSMATPAVSGTAALMRQYFEEGWYPTGAPTAGDELTPTGSLLKAMLLNSATGMEGLPALPASASSFVGWGRLVSDDVVELAGDARELYVEDVRHASGLTTGSVAEYAFDVTGSAEDLRVTLVWADAPPAPGAALAIVNDLDLEVIAPDASSYLGNNFLAGASVTGGVIDTLNTVEQIWIPAPDAGTWTVRVTGSSIPDGPQGFAIVVTGEIQTPSRPLTIAAIDPPAVIEPNDTGVSFDVLIDEGDDALVAGSAKLAYRYAGPGFQEADLVMTGPSTYRADLPSAVCAHQPEFFVSAEGVATGGVASPVSGGAAFTAVVGELVESTIFAETFDAGLPGDWTASGLWNVTSSCATEPVCDEAPWAYFGSTGLCSYGTGVAEDGELETGVIVLPPLGPGESLRLEYCSSMENENVSRFDVGKVLVGSAEVDQAPDTGRAWETRSIDLSDFAGQAVTIRFTFDTFDTFANNFHGWQVDNVRVVLTEVACVEPCPGDVNGDLTVDIFDFAEIAATFGLGDGNTRQQGDLTGDGLTDIFDFADLAATFGSDCSP